MGFFISEPLVPENSGSLPCAYCQKCRYREGCPYIYDQALYRAARQGRGTARLLTAEADRFLDRISHADNVCCMLNCDGDLERVLSHALHLEMPLLDELRAQAVKPIPGGKMDQWVLFESGNDLRTRFKNEYDRVF